MKDHTAARWEHPVLPGAAFACSCGSAQGTGLAKGDLAVCKPSHSDRLLTGLAGVKLPSYGYSTQEVWDKSAGNRQH